MNRLQAELQRLYHCHDTAAAGHGRVRAMVLELARPAQWDVLGTVWQGVQADLALPAPGIAVSGRDGYQLWFSLAEAVPAQRATALLEALRRRWLGEVAPERIGMYPGAVGPDCAVPPVEAAPGHWSAFVTSDLAALFADEPWLDLPPSPDAQADLLSRLQSIPLDDLQRAEERLALSLVPGASGTQPAAPGTASPASIASGTPAMPAGDGQDPRAFLLAVMNDRSVDLHLRIEAAKALLPHCNNARSA